MRILFAAAMLALLPQAIAQEQPSAEMKHLLVPRLDSDDTLSALSIQRGADYPSVIELRGSVRVRTRVMVLTADEVDYAEGTGEMDARGHVHVKMGHF